MMNIRQVKYLTLGRMKARYRNTVAGMLWVALNPILMFSAQAVVFKYILKIEIKDFALFLMAGLLPWLFITTSIDMCTNSIINSRELLKSFQINPLVLIFSQVFDNFFNFVLSFFILFIPALFYYDISLQGLLILPISFALLVIFIISYCSLLALLNVFYRDVQFVSSFSMNLLFFVTPIFYPESFVPENYRWAIAINPFYAVIKPIRSAIYNFDFGVLVETNLISLLFVLITTALSMILWKKRKNKIYAYL